VILPNYGLDSNPDEIRRTAELAEELGFADEAAMRDFAPPDSFRPLGVRLA
jgi:hypothetical protein